MTIVGLIILVIAIVLVCLALRLSGDTGRFGWGFGTRFFLVLLRLAIGWHFLVEGWDKVSTPAWSSEIYLRESTGPLSPWFRDLAGDRLVERLTVGADKKLPEELETDWQTYFDRFVHRYPLDAEQLKRAETIFRQSESKTLTWLTTDSKPMVKASPQGPPLTIVMTVSERLQWLHKQQEVVHDLETVRRPTFGKNTFAKLKEAKAEAGRIRSELAADLARQTAAMKLALRDALSSEQKQMDSPADYPLRTIGNWSRIDWLDATVKYGLFAVGVCLLAGFLTRLACVGGAAFLLMFFLAMPPLPGWPESPRLEGHYLYINKNIIEMLALLTLATTRSGIWVGLDGLLQFLNPWRRDERREARSEGREEADPAPRSSSLAPHPSSFVPHSTESAHGP